jgi:hypothetical protein
MLRKAVIVLALLSLSLPSVHAKKAEARNEDVPKGPSIQPPAVAAPTHTGSTPVRTGQPKQGGDSRGSGPSGNTSPVEQTKPSGPAPGK